MWKATPLILILMGLAGTVGCAHYEFDVVRPDELAAHVGSKDDATVTRDPLEYKLRTVDNRLVVRIYNNTDDLIQLVGEHSSAVDPNGQSHPLRNAPIAAHSFTKLIFPPLRPHLERTGPSFGIGVGTYVGDARPWAEHGDPFYDPWYDEPRYLAVIDDDALYWDWNGEGEMRVTFAFQRGDKTFSHEFVIRRVKV